jgi:hypothetical protein
MAPRALLMLIIASVAVVILLGVSYVFEVFNRPASETLQSTEPVPVVSFVDSDLDGISDAREAELGTNPHRLTIVAECYVQPGSPGYIQKSIGQWKNDFATKIDFVNLDGSRGIEVVGADTCTVLPAGLDFKGAYDEPVITNEPFITAEARERTSLGKYINSTLGPSNPGEISYLPEGGIKMEGREKMQIIFADFKGSGFEHAYAGFPDPRYRQIVIDPSYGLEHTSWLLSHETGRFCGLEDGEEFGKNWTDVLESKKANGEKLFGRW